MESTDAAPHPYVGRDVSQPARQFGNGWALQERGEDWETAIISGRVVSCGGEGSTRQKPFVVEWLCMDGPEQEALKQGALEGPLV